MTASLYAHLTDDLMVVDDDLSNLPADKQWCVWKVNTALVKRIDNVRYMAVQPFLFTDAITWGYITEPLFYEDRWCYENAALAIAAAHVWDGNAPYTEPEGWHRHPRSGRRREHGDPNTEYVNP